MSNVVRTGPDRPVGPVGPGTGHVCGSVWPEKRAANKPVKIGRTGEEPGQTGELAGA
ncbi:hypothetical protein A2U01_0070499, partial [Trifolium medium]|nr:hypothetical protein [Trifolium medium]